MSKGAIHNVETGVTTIVDLPDEETLVSDAPEKTIEERIEEMAEQLVLAQEALDFLIMGGV